MKDFFISHSSLDKESIVDDLVTQLQLNGFSVWYDKDCILAGDNIFEKVTDGLNEAFCIIIVLTSNFNSSKWGHIEMGIFSNIQRRIIPLICNKDDSPHKASLNFIQGLKYLNLTQNNIPSLINELDKALTNTKADNEELIIVDELKTILTKLNSYETCAASLISKILSVYLDFITNYQDFVVVCALRLARHIAIDVLSYAKPDFKFNDKDDEKKIFSLVIKNNICNKNISEFFIFIQNQNINNVSTSNIITISQAIRGLLKWYIGFRYPATPKKIEIDIIHPEQLQKCDFVEMYNIDKLVMREDLIASVETIYGEWYMANSFTHIAIKDTLKNKLIGYCAMLPITDETYEKILTGDFMDKDFNQDSIRQYDLPSDTYKLYVAGLAVHPEYQQTSAFTILYNAIIDLLLSLAKEREIYIAEVIAEASTKQGEKFCNILKMKNIKKTIYGTNIYTLELIPPQFRISTSNSKILYNICAQKYEENRNRFE